MNLSLIWSQFTKQRMAVAGLVVVLLFFVVAFFASWITPHSPTAYDLDSILLPPSYSCM